VAKKHARPDCRCDPDLGERCTVCCGRNELLSRVYDYGWPADLTVADFGAVCVEVLIERCPGWTDDEVKNHQFKSEYCVAVRRKTRTRCPDELVLRALTAHRKHGNSILKTRAKRILEVP